MLPVRDLQEFNHESGTVFHKLPTPLPVRQLVVLCAMRLTEPISYTLIFPFVNQMIRDLRVTDDPKKIGYYGGVVESIFAVCQLCTALFWGRLSDHVGRKPVMLTGLTGTTISVISFGLQKSFVGMLIARGISGMMNGNIAILQSVVAEITDETNFAQAMALLPLCYACGLIIGPIIGGYLAAPAQQYPELFGGYQILVDNPYFLPCLIGGMCNFGAICLGAFCLEETLPSKRKNSSSYQRVEHNKSDPTSRPASILSLCTKPVVTILFTFLTLHLQNTSWSAVLPLYCQTSVSDGGLGLSLNQIGLLLSMQGMGIIVFQTLFFPALQVKYGARKLLRYSLSCLYLPLLLIPLVSKSAQLDQSPFTISLALIVFTTILRTPLTMSYIGPVIILKELSPAPNCLGTLNGMLQTVAAFSQTLGPIMGSSLFAFSISSGWLGGYLVWVVMFLIALIPQALSFLPIRPIETRSEQSTNDVVGDLNSIAHDPDREIEDLNEFLRAQDGKISVPGEHQSSPILIRKPSFAGSASRSSFHSVGSPSSRLRTNHQGVSD